MTNSSYEDLTVLTSGVSCWPWGWWLARRGDAWVSYLRRGAGRTILPRRSFTGHFLARVPNSERAGRFH